MSDFPFDDRFYGIQNGEDATLNDVSLNKVTAYNIGVGGEIPEFIGDMKSIRAVTSQLRGAGTSLYITDRDEDSSISVRQNMLLKAEDYHWETTGANPLEKMTLTNSGLLGIGETNPKAPLDVGTETFGTLTTTNGLFGSKLTWNSRPGSLGTMSASQNAGITANFDDGDVCAHTFYAGHGINYQSDRRIKTDIQDIDDSEALITFRQLKPCKYKYKETLLSGRTTNYVYGYIAQEVADVLPHAVTIGDLKGTYQGHLPNIMSICDISLNDNQQTIISITKSLDTNTEGGYLCSDASNNITLKTINDFEKNTEDTYHPLIFYDKNKKLYESKITEVIDESTFIVDNLSVEKENMIDGNKLLLYGQKPNDFHRLNKDVIFTVTAAALQEVDRIQQQQQTKIEELEARISALENK